MHDVRPDELTDVRGHRLPLRRTWAGVARGRAAVVGDAAGLIDPLSGDGMFEAFLSSEIASATALDVLAGRVGRDGALPRRVQKRARRPRRHRLAGAGRAGAPPRPHLPRAALGRTPGASSATAWPRAPRRCGCPLIGGVERRGAPGARPGGRLTLPRLPRAAGSQAT